MSTAHAYLRAAEMRAAQGDGLPPAGRPPRTGAVIGAGTMGTGIAMALANAGIGVTLIDLEASPLERARAVIAAKHLDGIAFAAGLEAAAAADLVIEAVFEEMPVKQDVFRQLDQIARPDAMLATNTSTLDVDALAGVLTHPERLVGTHFFSPAHVMKLLEIVRGARTAPQAVANGLALAHMLHKIGVVAGNCDGFIGNRMLAGYKREVDFLLEEGASPAQIDRVIRDFGFPMGPCTMFDLAGLDVSWRVRKRRVAEGRLAGRYSGLEDRLCELGRFGQKTGAGFYRYEPGSRTPLPDPFVDELIAEVARAAGIARRATDDDEIRTRCLFPLINEAAAILADGIAARPGDVDVVWVYGYGFPASRGGPLHYADALGLPALVATLRALERVHGAAWTPAPLLVALADRGGSFASLDGEAA